jgi:hypothetical protein
MRSPATKSDADAEQPSTGLGHITVDTFGNLEFHILLLGPLILNDLQKANLYFLM